MAQPLIVGVGGTLRSRSSTESALRIVLQHAETLGAKTTLIAGNALVMPLYSGNGALEANAASLIESLRHADAIAISSPGYHGSVSGVVKNALDYCEELRDDRRPYFDGRSVACIAGAAGAQAAVQTLATLRGITHALRGWPTPLGIAFNSSEIKFQWNDKRAVMCCDANVHAQLMTVAEQLVAFCRFTKEHKTRSTPG